MYQQTNKSLKLFLQICLSCFLFNEFIEKMKLSQHNIFVQVTDNFFEKIVMFYLWGQALNSIQKVT